MQIQTTRTHRRGLRRAARPSALASVAVEPKGPPAAVDDAARLEAALDALEARQAEAGPWPGDYGGALFLTPMYVMAAEATGFDLGRARREAILSYLRGRQNADGGFGLHDEAPSSVFATTLVYVALRQLGLEAGSTEAASALRWVESQGGALGIASWGKLMLAVMGLYDYEGLNPLLPELWLLPSWAPIHPGRLWCHCRMVYLPMSFLYGVRAAVPETELVRALRQELYEGRWERIDWPAQRNIVARVDLHRPHGPVLDLVNEAQVAFEGVAPRGLRERALDEVLDQIRHEDDTTGFIDIGPVNQLLNLLVEHFVEPGSERVLRHHERLSDYLGWDRDGARVQGYNSSELWDTAFALQAMVASPAGRRRDGSLRRGYAFVRDNQVIEEVPEGARYYRHPAKGGWPFSDRPHGWPISDCTAEGLKTALLLEDLAGEGRIADERLRDAVRFILSTQNRDGGFPTYERQRGSRLLELLNPSEVFGDIMVDYSYPELTSSCVQALVAFRRRYPGVLGREIQTAVGRGVGYLLDVQREDGSWYGSWGICFTYGTWFAVTGLRAAGLRTTHPAIAAARRFLLSRQREDGGWCEHFSSCQTGQYVEAESSHVVQTAWALMALIRCGAVESEAVRRGVDLLHRRQRPDGSWAREAMAGVFNQTCMLNYDNYYQVFPTWALALAASERR